MTLFAVHREAGPAWIDGTGAFGQPGVNDHAAFMNDLAEQGLILFAGPLDGTENDRIRVLMVADANNDTVIAKHLAIDPWELERRITTTSIEPWTLFTGAIHQSPEHDPPR